MFSSNALEQVLREVAMRGGLDELLDAGDAEGDDAAVTAEDLAKIVALVKERRKEHAERARLKTDAGLRGKLASAMVGDGAGDALAGDAPAALGAYDEEEEEDSAAREEARRKREAFAKEKVGNIQAQLEEAGAPRLREKRRRRRRRRRQENCPGSPRLLRPLREAGSPARRRLLRPLREAGSQVLRHRRRLPLEAKFPARRLLHLRRRAAGCPGRLLLLRRRRAARFRVRPHLRLFPPREGSSPAVRLLRRPPRENSAAVRRLLLRPAALASASRPLRRRRRWPRLCAR